MYFIITRHSQYFEICHLIPMLCCAQSLLLSLLLLTHHTNNNASEIWTWRHSRKTQWHHPCQKSRIRHLLDKHAPELSRSITLRTHSPWYSAALRHKRDKRLCERAFGASRLEIRRQMYQVHYRKYTAVLNQCKVQCYKSKIESADQGQLFHLIYGMFKVKLVPSLHVKVWNKISLSNLVNILSTRLRTYGKTLLNVYLPVKPGLTHNPAPVFSLNLMKSLWKPYAQWWKGHLPSHAPPTLFQPRLWNPTWMNCCQLLLYLLTLHCKRASSQMH